MAAQPLPQRRGLIGVPILCQQHGLNKQLLQSAGLTSDSTFCKLVAGRNTAHLTRPCVHYGTTMLEKQIPPRTVR